MAIFQDLRALANELHLQAARHRSLACTLDDAGVARLVLSMALSLDSRAAEIEGACGDDVTRWPWLAYRH